MSNTWARVAAAPEQSCRGAGEGERRRRRASCHLTHSSLTLIIIIIVDRKQMLTFMTQPV